MVLFLKILNNFILKNSKTSKFKCIKEPNETGKQCLLNTYRLNEKHSV